MGFVKSIFACACVLTSLAVTQGEEQKSLEAELFQLDALRVRHKTSKAEVEQCGAELLAIFTTPEEQALIHFRMAHVYAQSGLMHSDLLMEHCRTAMNLPLPPDKLLIAHTYLGDMLQKGTAQEDIPFPQRRRAAADVYIQGIARASEFDLPVKKPELLEPPAPFSSSESGQSFDEYLKELKAYRQKQAEMERLADLWEYRRILIDQVCFLYIQQPAAKSEMEESIHAAVESDLARWVLEKRFPFVESKYRQNAQSTPQVSAIEAKP